MCIGLYIAQDRFLFLPDKLSEQHRFRMGEEVEIQVDGDIYLNAIHIKTPNPKGVILYLHGNKGSNRRCLRQATTLSGNDYDIFMPDYRGYGKSDGTIFSEKQLYNDVQKVYNYLKEKFDESEIVVVGYSLGTGMASYLAAHNNPKQLVLNSPFISICDLKDRKFPIVPDLLVKYHLNNEKNLQDVTVPTAIFHGTNDELIPYDSSEKLQRINTSLFHLYPLTNSGHRHAIFSEVFSTTVSEILKKN
jgi:esterase/lipase